MPIAAVDGERFFLPLGRAGVCVPGKYATRRCRFEARRIRPDSRLSANSAARSDNNSSRATTTGRGATTTGATTGRATQPARHLNSRHREVTTNFDPSRALPGRRLNRSCDFPREWPSPALGALEASSAFLEGDPVVGTQRPARTSLHIMSTKQPRMTITTIGADSCDRRAQILFLFPSGTSNQSDFDTGFRSLIPPRSRPATS
jgi:hypothetical protein